MSSFAKALSLGYVQVPSPRHPAYDSWYRWTEAHRLPFVAVLGSGRVWRKVERDMIAFGRELGGLAQRVVSCVPERPAVLRPFTLGRGYLYGAVYTLARVPVGEADALALALVREAQEWLHGAARKPLPAPFPVWAQVRGLA